MQYEQIDNDIFSMKLSTLFTRVIRTSISVRAEALKATYDQQQPLLCVTLTDLSAIEAMKGDNFEQKYQAYAEQYQMQVLTSVQQQLNGYDVYYFTYKIDAEFQGNYFDIQGASGCILLDDMFCLDFSVMYETSVEDTWQPCAEEMYQSIVIKGDRDSRHDAYKKRVAEVQAETMQESTKQQQQSMADTLKSYNVSEFNPPRDNKNSVKIGNLPFSIEGDQCEFIIGKASRKLRCKIVVKTESVAQGEEAGLFREDNGVIILSTDIKHVYQAGKVVCKIPFEQGKTGAPHHYYLRCEGIHYALKFTGIVECRDGWFSCRGYLGTDLEHKADFPIEVYHQINEGTLAWEEYRFSDTEALTAPPEVVRFLHIDDPDTEKLPVSVLTYQQLIELGIYGRYDYINPESVRSPLNEIPEGIAQLSRLKHLSIANTCLETLPDTIGELIHLEHVSFANNALTTLPASLFQLPALKYVYLKNNKLSKLPDTINLPCLHSVDVSRNELVTLPTSLASQPELKRLDLQDNPWQSLPDNCNHIEQIELGIDDKKRLLDYEYPGANGRGVITWDDSVFYAHADMGQVAQLSKAIENTFLKDYEAALLHIALKAVCLVSTEKDDYSSLGNTRFGGLPDLPTGESYPCFYSDYYEEERGYQFIAQLNCAELSEYQAYLPRKGMLYFYLLDQESFTCRVMYAESDNHLCSARELSIQEDYIADDHGVYEPFKADASNMIAIPHFYSDDYWCKGKAEALLEIEEDDDKSDQFSHIRDELSKRLGGKGVYQKWNNHYYPDAHHAINTYVFTQHESPQEQAAGLLKGNPEDWIVLLKVHSDNNTGFCFWDAGEISFLIHKSDLAQHDFSNVCCTLETS